MAKDPAFLFYPADWLSGVMGMTFEQKGAYFELLIYQFNNGKFSLAQAKQVLGICFSSVWEVVGKKFKNESGLLWNERLQLEIDKRKNFTNSRRINALGKKTNNKKTKAQAKHMHKHMGNENTNRNINTDRVENGNLVDEPKVEIYPTFNDFWNLYDKKIDRPKCEKKWGNLSQKEKEACMEYIPVYQLSQPDKQYRRHPETFLNNKTWENEVIRQNGHGQPIKTDWNEVAKSGEEFLRKQGLA